MKKGLTHIYTGDGKGKTTAAMGLALRALGCGLTVRVYQFCKGMPSGELEALKKFERAQLFRADCPSGKFPWDMGPEEKEKWIDAQQALFDEACEAACDADVDMVILDEAFGALKEGGLDAAQLKYLIGHKYRGVELILTGRDAPPELLERADYATEMVCLKHPFREGTQARRGVEY